MEKENLKRGGSRDRKEILPAALEKVFQRCRILWEHFDSSTAMTEVGIRALTDAMRIPSKMLSFEALSPEDSTDKWPIPDNMPAFIENFGISLDPRTMKEKDECATCRALRLHQNVLNRRLIEDCLKVPSFRVGFGCLSCAEVLAHAHAARLGRGMILL